MSLHNPDPDDSGDSWPWPPEVPPHRPPHRPPDRPPYEPQPERPAPTPILPSWEERPYQRDLADRLLEQRIILVGGNLDHAMANHVASQLLLLGRGNRPIELHLDIPESDLHAALALAETVDVIRSPVNVVVRGALRGPAVAVLCAGEKRVAHRHALLVLSLPPPQRAEGTAYELAALAEQYERQVDAIRDRIRETSGRPEDEVAADLRSGRVLSAEEARDYGLLTELL